MAFQIGDLLAHRVNTDLGPGRVEECHGRRVTLFFRRSGSRLTFNASDEVLAPITLGAGDPASLEPGPEPVVIAQRLDAARFRLADGREVDAGRLWPAERPSGAEERLAALDVDMAGHFVNRLDALVLERERQAGGLGSFLGGRIQIFPHQLHVAERAVASDPVRWLLADEVGLGKTVEACLILARLLRTGRAERALVVAPGTLTVQWLSELWRKFHQVFVLLDPARRADVVRELGKGFNPFEAHARMVVAIEELAADPALAASAAEAPLDVLVVDEAHRLDRRRGHPGSPAYRAVAPLAARARDVLLLSATPLEADVHGFFRLLELLRPEGYASEDAFTAALAEGRPLPPCTSATRRVDIGGIPPRRPLPVDLEGPLPRAGLSGRDEEDARDPRVVWLAAAARRWARGESGGSAVTGDDPGLGDPMAGEGKALVFVHDRTTLASLKTRLEAATGRRVAIFHEDLAADRRDLEVAEFRRPEGPTLLVSTECGGEGRNFEFCRRLVLFDLPRDPAEVEQRIGRLDRVTRRRPIEIVYFRPQGGFEAELVRFYEELGVLRQPLGGLERTLGRIAQAIREGEAAFAKTGEPLPQAELVRAIRDEVEARERAVFHHLHQGGYEARLKEPILRRVPADLDALHEHFVVRACELLGFESAEKPGARSFYFELGGNAIVDSLPGVPGGTRFLGTFDREEALVHEELEYFASGHPLVEGLLAELEDGSRGRAALLELPGAGQPGVGVLRIVAGARGPEATALDLAGRARPDWARLIVEKRDALRGITREEWERELPEGLDWPTLVAKAPGPEAPGLLAVAGIRLRV
jgi:ATP-dependent helicase HepA